MRESVNSELFVVAEYWHPDMEALQAYLDLVDQQLMLFDVGLLHRLHDVARAGGDFDLRTLFDDALVAASPHHAMTIVGNHDTQPLQALEAPVEDWFKPLTYALILIREQGVPCIFYPDLYGAKYSDAGGDGETHEIEIMPVPYLPKLIEARQRFANGPQTDLFDNQIALALSGTAQRSRPVAFFSSAMAQRRPRSSSLGQSMPG
ncbi:hypothetical protein [Sphingobium sp. YR768]|uniref:hypothetical protein n=1 Tax=Sphingobium sp. YR768 TaxID=1884365 RepID=UPI0008C28755|nr:hypothetical protein SAMN05518866_11915 [Sphingobium sp. YR768]